MKKINEYGAVLDIDSENKLLSLRIEKYIDEDFVDITEDQLNERSYEEKEITLTSFFTGESVTFRNENGFTVGQLFDAILKFELIDRPKTDWFGGIDVHHIFFEGLDEVEGKDNTYTISWGS